MERITSIRDGFCQKGYPEHRTQRPGSGSGDCTYPDGICGCFLDGRYRNYKSEYRQFVHWVRDSIARQMLGQQYPEFLIMEDRDGNPIDPPRISWRERIRWDDPDYLMALQDLFIPDNERFLGRREIDPRKLFYEFWWIDYQQAARRANSYNFETQRYEGTVFDPTGTESPNRKPLSIYFQGPD
jgi:hypothetical protein